MKKCAKCGGSMKMKTGGVVVKMNGNQPVQKSAGAPMGVGHTKSVKASAQKKAGSNGVGKAKSATATVSPKK